MNTTLIKYIAVTVIASFLVTVGFFAICAQTGIPYPVALIGSLLIWGTVSYIMTQMENKQKAQAMEDVARQAYNQGLAEAERQNRATGS